MSARLLSLILIGTAVRPAAAAGVSTASVAELTYALHRGSSSERAEAARELGSRGADAGGAVGDLIGMLRGEGEPARAASEALGKIGRPAYEPLAGALERAELRHVERYLLALEGIGSEDALAVVRRERSAPAIAVELDPRLELLGAVQKEAREGDGGHPAVRWYASWLGGGGDRVRLAEFVLHLDRGLSFAGVEHVPAGLRDELGGEAGSRDFCSMLRDFAESSGFARRFSPESSLYRGHLEAARSAVAGDASPEALSAYLGLPIGARLVVLLAPGFDAGGAAIARRAQAGAAKNFEARFLDDSGDFSLDDPGSSAAHALAHSMLDPLAGRLAAGLKDRAGALSAGCRTGSYAGESRCLDEELVLAVMLRLRRLGRGDGAYEEKLASARARGFPRLDAMLKSLERYEGSRSRFPTLEAFLPELAGGLMESSAAVP